MSSARSNRLRPLRLGERQGSVVSSQDVWPREVAQAEGHRKRATSERNITSRGTALVRSSRHRQARLQNQALHRKIMKQPAKQLALCLENEGNEASLILGKVYRILPDAQAAKDDFVRIIDESGEDYLFHKSQFAFVEFPLAVRRKILALQEASYQGV